MAVVISNRGRLISDLTPATTLSGNDLLVIQSLNASNNLTRKTTLTTLSDFVLSTFGSFPDAVDFQNADNRFTGSFFNPNGKTSNLHTVTIRSNLTMGAGSTATISPTNLTFIPANGSSFQTKVVNTIGGITGSANTGFTGSLKGRLTGNVTGNIIGNVTGNLTGNVTGNVNGNLTGDVTGNSVGNLTGDVLNANSNKILENGSGTATANGGYPNAFFYGTSSYATQALTAAFASSGTGALPGGGSQYQVVIKDGSGGATWSTPITRSGVPTANYVSYWTDSKTLAASNMAFFNGIDTFQVTNFTATGIITANSSITGSLYGAVTSPPSSVTLAASATATINGDLYPSSKLTVNGTGGTVTINLRKGKTCTVYVHNAGAFTLTWNASIDGGSSTTSIYWKNGIAPTLTAFGKDVFTFVNIDDNVFASAIQNFS